MAKLTKKYTSATKVLNQLNLPVIDDNNQLYDKLTRLDYNWDSVTKQWFKSSLPQLPPTDLIRVRVWGDARSIELSANNVVKELESSLNWELVERSSGYMCRPPKQSEARVYLSFKPRM